MRIAIAWPPENPTSTRLNSSGIGLHQLGQHATRPRRVQERHETPPYSTPGFVVDCPQATPLAELERGGDVIAPVRGVMDPRPPLGKELSDRRVLREGRKQLDM